jgi:glutathione S-transferase
LNIKNIPYEYIVVETVGIDDAVTNARNSINKEDNLLKNPQGLMPTLVINGESVVQSTALVEFIEDAFEGPCFTS